METGYELDGRSSISARGKRFFFTPEVLRLTHPPPIQ
jgi:hypothetical protein